MLRHDIINELINKHNKHFVSYLEIGYGTGENFDKIVTPYKTGVDIGSGVPVYLQEKCIIKSSDDFFKENELNFDIIFIDGSHLWENVNRDIHNALNIINPSGSIVIHDCNPPGKDWQERQQIHGVPGWCGDGWKSFLNFRTSVSNINMFTVDTDYGCGVIQEGTQELFPMQEDVDEMYTYDFFYKNKKEILNLISVDEFRWRMK